MGVKFTKEQQQVIDLRDCNILVSAAAGSGKTAVLVERIITRLTKDAPLLDVDQLLIVTFTEAAAAEMKERIHLAIEKTLEENPGNVHLERQATLIHQAQITTIHKFCLSVIQEYFHTIDLDPGFRVGDEGELKLLKKDVLEQVLETAYEEAKPEFLSFVESFASGRDDRKLEELILQMYEFSRSYPNPNSWLETCANQYHIESVEELEENPFVLDIMREIHLYLQDMEDLLEYAIGVCEGEDGPKAYGNALQSDLMQIRKLRMIQSFSQMQEAVLDIKWDKLSANRNKEVSETKINLVKTMRDEVKSLVKMIAEQYCYADVSELQQDMFAAKEHMQVLIELVKQFSCEFLCAKQSKNLIDFNDMEHYALQILTKEEDGSFVPTAVAENYQQKFAEVMIDEYQDSNFVQEAILTSVSRESQGKYNIFMVGDVKQSIYRFRLSRPELFMEKFHTYSLDAGVKRRIDLHKNFRSRREVLESTNFVFEQIMTSPFGGICYDEKAALYVGADYQEMPGNQTEFLLVDAPGKKANERAELEAVAVAEKIKQLMATHQVLDKETGEYRKLRYSDIVILSRSLKGWTDVFADALQGAGIPSYTGSKEGYFQTQEIQLLLNYLRILDNPKQDIPFTAVLSSVFAGISSEELAILQNSTDKKNVYESVCAYMEHGELVELKERLRAFLDIYEDFRNRVPYLAIHVLLWQILDKTGYGDYVSAMPRGEQRAANLQMLIEKAVAFENTSYKGLFHFVRYIEQLQKYDIDYGEANIMDEQADVVCLMSIHKSKGLEFPIVFVTGLGKQFNQQDTRQSVVLHSDLGAGIDVIDPTLRTKAPTLLKKAIIQRVQRESTAEELRVLYVAMTRAKEKLILTGSVSDLEKQVANCMFLSGRSETALPYYSLTKANKYMDWVLPALFRNQCFAPILEGMEISTPFQNPRFHMEVPVKVSCITEEALIVREVEERYTDRITKEILDMWDTEQIYDAEMKTRLEEQLGYEYPYAESRVIKQTLTVSELKKRMHMEEGGESPFREEDVIPLLPKFLQEQEELKGASRGSAYHKLLELLDYTREYNEVSLQNAIDSMRRTGSLTEDMVSCIRTADILAFIESSIGKRVQKAARCGKFWAEQAFALGLEASRVYPETDSDDLLLVQGIIDVYFEEDGELVVLDYKTDKVSCEEELKEKYHAQLDYYAEALHRLTGKTIKEKVIYSFALKKEILL